MSELLAVIEQNETRFVSVMEQPSKFDKLKHSFLSELNKNPALAKCSHASLAGTLMKISQLGLDVGVVDECYIIPYKGEATLQVSYKGLIKVAYQSGMVTLVRSETVFEDDKFEFNIAEQKIVKHTPGSMRTNPVGFYAEITLTNGKKIIKYMTMEQIAERRKKSRGQNFWNNGFESMAQKVCVREALRLIPKSKVTYIDKPEVEIGQDMGLESRKEQDAALDAELLS